MYTYIHIFIYVYIKIYIIMLANTVQYVGTEGHMTIVEIHSITQIRNKEDIYE